MTAPTILVVDDDAAIRDLLMEVFECEGYRVTTAANGAEALRLLGQVRPWLILLDVMMPVLDGFGVAQELRRRGSPIPILIISTLADTVSRVQVLGVVGYLEKPFDLFALLATVAGYCARWQH